MIQLTAVVLMFSACQKEVSQEDPNSTPGIPGSGSGTGTRLVRTGTRLGTDTVTIDYSYNSANFLSGISLVGTSQGQPFTVSQKINRNASNAITSVVVKSPLLLLLNFGSDSLMTQFVFNASNERYTRSITNFIYDNEPLTDSTLYGYSSAGKLNAATVYFSDGSSGYFPALKTEYAFAENNLVETKLYEFDGTNFELAEVTTFRHDSKVNPLPIGSEAALLVFSKVYPLPFSFWLQIGLNDFFSLNNLTNMKVNYLTTAESEETVTTYTYNSKNLPETASRTIDGTPFAVTRYFYQ